MNRYPRYVSEHAFDLLQTVLQATGGLDARHVVGERKRCCQAVTRHGQPCRAPALTDGDLCLAHSGKTKLDSRKAAERSAQVRRQRALERRETLRDKLARKLEAHADEVVAAYLSGVRSSDERVAYRAAEAWLSRVYGRPKETIETVKQGEMPSGLDPADLAKLPREERSRIIRELATQYPDLAERVLGPRRLAAVADTVDSVTGATPNDA